MELAAFTGIELADDRLVASVSSRGRIGDVSASEAAEGQGVLLVAPVFNFHLFLKAQIVSSSSSKWYIS